MATTHTSRSLPSASPPSLSSHSSHSIPYGIMVHVWLGSGSEARRREVKVKREGEPCILSCLVSSWSGTLQLLYILSTLNVVLPSIYCYNHTEYSVLYEVVHDNSIRSRHRPITSSPSIPFRPASDREPKTCKTDKVFYVWTKASHPSPPRRTCP